LRRCLPPTPPPQHPSRTPTGSAPPGPCLCGHGAGAAPGGQHPREGIREAWKSRGAGGVRPARWRKSSSASSASNASPHQLEQPEPPLLDRRRLGGPQVERRGGRRRIIPAPTAWKVAVVIRGCGRVTRRRAPPRMAPGQCDGVWRGAALHCKPRSGPRRARHGTATIVEKHPPEQKGSS